MKPGELETYRDLVGEIVDVNFASGDLSITGRIASFDQTHDGVPILVTFDDGRLVPWHAISILRRRDSSQPITCKDTHKFPDGIAVCALPIRHISEHRDRLGNTDPDTRWWRHDVF